MHERLPVLWDIIPRYRYFFSDEGRPLWQNVALLRHVAVNYPNWHTDKDILHRWKLRKTTPKAYRDHGLIRKEPLPAEGVLNADEALELLARNRGEQ
jgi:hypothetical protein